MKLIKRTMMPFLLAVVALLMFMVTPTTVLAYVTDDKEMNSMGEASRLNGRLLYSFDLKGQKFKTHYFDPFMLQPYSGWYTLSGLDGLDAKSITNLLKIYNALIDYGYSEAMAAGACGNFWQECHFDSSASDGGYGFVQWCGSRKSGLIDYAASRGRAWSDIDIQIEYLIGELDGGYNREVNKFLSRYGRTSTSSVSDVDLAVEAFCAGVEGCICFSNNGKQNCRKHCGECAVASDGVWYQQLNNRLRYANMIADAITRLSGGLGTGGDFGGMNQSQVFASIFGYTSKMQTIQMLSRQQMDSYMVTMRLSNGKSITINKALADDTKEALEEMIANGFEIRQLTGYSYRGVNSGKGYYYSVKERPSYHSFGLAIDINWDENPQLSAMSSMKDASGIGYSDAEWNYLRSNYKPFKDKHALTTVEYGVMRSHGFSWGRDFGQGSWPDMMHFSVGEVSNAGIRSWMSTRLETENRGYR